MKKIALLLLACSPWYFQAQTLFTQVTDPNNPLTNFANTPAVYKGAAWIDLDGDNLPDLFASQRFLFHNDGNGQFSVLPNVQGATTGQNAAGSSWGDINNDGFPDAITASLFSGLHLNAGDQTFSPGNDSLDNFDAYSGWDCALADADQNGLLDLVYVHACCGFHPSGPFSCRFYLQMPGGSFVLQTGYEFTDQTAPYTIPVWSDYDLDGDLDLFIGSGPASSAGPDFCYKNLLKETGTFSLSRLTEPPFDALQNGQTYNFPDFDNDGDLDICLTNYSGVPTRMWRNDGNGAYTSLVTPFTPADGFLANTWGDLDNDGDLDVLISFDGSAAVRCYRNLGNGAFGNLETAGNAGAGVCGIALADYDNDGDLDFFTHGGGAARALFRNDNLAAGRHWAQFTLQGTASNRSAIGALVRVKAVIGGAPVWQMREVSAHNSFQSQNDLRQHFGLNDAILIDSVQVHWPSGLVENFAGLSADHFYKIIEGEGISQILAQKETSGAPEFDISPNPVDASFRITSADAIQSVSVFDSSGKGMLLQFERQIDGARCVLPETLPAGNWMLRVQFRNGRWASKPLIKL
ncbi:MAG TPA: FG-GAP-like repeat-containing protein [Saprospiraceae bacterium]|nr:FG-GAP-like repeat-containing protein [Saprospiraceae bacterium]